MQRPMIELDLCSSVKPPRYVSIGKHMPVRLFNLGVPCLDGADDADLPASSEGMPGFPAQLLCHPSSIA